MQIGIKTSIKHLQINKANNAMFVTVAVASLVVVFSLLSAKALLSQSSFQHKVLKEKNNAIKALKNNISAANTLKTQYEVFESGNPNIIGGQGGISTGGNGPSDGDNARIALDALPSQYDFPALTSTLEKIVNIDNITKPTISGTDSSIGITSSTSNTDSSSGQSQPVPTAFSVGAQTDYNNSLTLLKDFERSIRPFDVTNLVLQGGASGLTINIQANTYYQPSVSLQIGKKEINK